MKILTLDDLDLAGKRTLVRVDFNVPIEFGEVTDDLRIREAIPTIQAIREKGGIVVLMSLLGRPKGEAKDSLRLDPVAKRLQALLGAKVKVRKFDEVVGPKVEKGLAALKRATERPQLVAAAA